MQNSVQKYYVLLILCILFTGIADQAIAQQIPGSAPGSVLKEQQPDPEGITSFHTPVELQDDETKFSTTVFTFTEILIFAYSNDTEITILDAEGDTVQTKILQKDEYHVQSNPAGIYRIFGSKSFTALIGDATSNIVQGYYAVDQSGRGTSTLFNTYMMEFYQGEEKFIVSAYQNGTNFTIKDLDTGDILHAGVLQAGQHYTMPQTPYDKFLQVSASKPVSALSYGDMDYYVPSSNGTFAGTEFLGYSAYIGNWTNSITVTGYHDSTDVVVTNTVSGDTISAYTLNEGEVNSESVNNEVYWKVESSQPVIAGNVPYADWTGNYHYMTRAIDQTGIGSGNLFYMPTIGSRIDVFSFDDANDVKIQRLGREVDYPYQDTLIVYEGSLNAGEGYNFSSPSDRYVYKIESSGNVSVIQSNGEAGAEFMPLDFAMELPDLAVSANDIIFSPEKDSYDEGEEITVTATIHNHGPIDVSNASIHFYEGDPDGDGRTPLLENQVIPFVEGHGSENVTFDYIVPEDPKFKSMVVKVDPDEQIRESNSANNKASRPIVPNDDLQPPLAVIITPNGGLGLDENEEINPNPFTVEATILNTGTVEALDVEINLALFDGLTLEGGPADTTIVAIAAESQIKMNWLLSADIDMPGVNRYQINVSASNAESKEVNRAINIPNNMPPAAPEGLTATSMEVDGEVLLEWQPNEERDLAGYEIHFGTESGVYEGFTTNDQTSPIVVKKVSEFELTGLDDEINYFISLRAFNHSDKTSESSEEISISNGELTSINDREDVPVTYDLYQNYPNPFNPTTQIQYSVEQAGDVHLAVYNMLGQQVSVLVNEHKPEGMHEVTFDASHLSSGVYLYRIQTGNFVRTRNLTFIK